MCEIKSSTPTFNIGKKKTTLTRRICRLYSYTIMKGALEIGFLKYHTGSNGQDFRNEKDFEA